MSQNQNHFYRADIDGLRAIAILSVVIFHMIPEYFPGGFAGVDVFFVISGYLISSIIMRQMEKKSFSFVDFYVKRAIRLFPSLLIVLFGTLLIGWFVLLPSEFKQLGKHVAGGSGFLANIVLFKEVNYFNKASELKPLLHLWSLGIEEQFYFFWPVVLFCLWKINSKYVSYVLLILIGCSFGINLYNVSIKPEFAFFMPQSRFWELFFGCLLGYFDFKNFKIKDSLIKNVIAVIGLVLCLLSFALLDGNSKFPGYWALMPVIGTSLLILSGSNSYLNKNLLSNRALVFVGLISYPFYLWHWPLLSFSQIMHNGPAPIMIRVMMVLIAFGLAYLSYKYVESPLKNLITTKKIGMSKALLTGLGATAICGLLISKNILSPLSSRLGLEKVDQALNDWDYPGRLKQNFDEKGNRVFEQGTSRERVLFMGDSHMEQYYPRVESLLQKPNSPSIIFVTGGGCPPIPNLKHDGKYNYCESWIDNGFRIAEGPGVKNIVIAAQWVKYGENDFYIENNGKKEFLNKDMKNFKKALLGLKVEIQKLIQMNKKVFLVKNIPFGKEFDPNNLLQRTLSLNPIKYVETPITKEIFFNRYADILKVLKEIADESGAKVIDPLNYLCNNLNNECAISVNQTPIYKDLSHLRPFYVKDYVRYIDETMSL